MNQTSHRKGIVPKPLSTGPSFSPNSKRHAIEQAVVGIRLLEDASESEFENALKVATELKDAFDLPGQFAVDAMALMFGRQVLTMGYRSAPSEMKPGALFQCVSKSGVMESELTIERSAVTFRTSNYSRWVDMQNYISGLLAPVAASLCSGNIQRVTAIELRCMDKFTSNTKSPILTDLIDGESELIADWLKGKRDLLHSHLGWFE